MVNFGLTMANFRHRNSKLDGALDKYSIEFLLCFEL